MLPQLQASLPASINVAVLTDRTISIRASIADVQFELLLAVILWCWSFSSSAQRRRHPHPSIAVPLSLVGTFGVMYLVVSRSTTSR